MRIKLRLTGGQYRELRNHLFPGDRLEAVAVALCGRRAGESVHCLTVHDLIPVPYDDCERAPGRVTWSTRCLVPLLKKAMARDMAILRIHSHPSGLAEFSELDDESDRDLFASVFGWTDSESPHASAVMVPDGRIFARAITEGVTFAPIASVTVAGDDLKFYFADPLVGDLPGFTLRHAQLFGAATTTLLRRLTVGVVGCSGTGSIVIEQLARLGVGRLVLVDPDHIEEKNLNRIPNATREDAYLKRPKVEVAARAIAHMGFGTELELMAENLYNPRAVRAVAECDVVFGCMDGAEGRHLLNRLASFYTIPYFDVGVALEADGKGGVDEISGVVHYVQPGGATLLERKAYTMKQVEAEGLRRTDPKRYRQQLKEGYIHGVREDRPAVISVNMLFSSMVVLEFLARVHGFRYDHNREFASTYANLVQNATLRKEEVGPSTESPLTAKVGRGDLAPLLDMPALSEPGE
jgi:hypothetical protein